MLKIDPLPILMDKAPLHIRYKTAERFLPDEKELLEELANELYDYKPREKLFKAQQPDGTWKLVNNYTVEEHKKGMKFLRQLMSLSQLYDYACTREHIVIQKGLIALLKMQKPDGKFPLLHHHHAYALWLLVQFGLVGNPFVEKGFRWIAKRQREDGGWLSPSMLPSSIAAKTAKSGIWTTLLAFEAFSGHSRLKNSPICEKASEFVLENYLQPNQTSLFPEPDAWSYIYTDYTPNGLFRGGTLRFLEALAPLPEKHNHPNFKKAVNWILEQQLHSGLYPAVVGRSEEGDFGVTLRVLTVLKAIEKAE